MAQRPLIRRPDGKVNVTLEPDVVAMLDSVIDETERKLGFRPTRSQGLKYVLKLLETIKTEARHG